MDTKLNQKLEVRSGDRTEFKPCTEVERFISETVKAHYAENGFKSSEFYISNTKWMTLGIINTPEMGENFDEFCEKLVEKLTPILSEKSFRILNPIKSDMHTIIHIVAESNLRKLTPNEKLKMEIEDLISKAYAEKGYESTAQVILDDKKEIKVMINSEEPYMGLDFFEFSSKLETQVIEFLSREGYYRKKGEFMYDYWIITFEYKA